jgi:hypothetical protein
MKHLSSILLAAALVAAGTTACFDDPTSDLMNGPARIDLQRSVIHINLGDSTTIQAEVKDQAGNVFNASDAVWEAVDAAVAAANKDTARTIPGGMFSRVYIKGLAAGQTYVKVTSNGLTDSLRVVVIPPTFAGTVLPATSNVGDTVTITATSALTFSTAAGIESEVTVGGHEVYLLSRTASAIKFIGPRATTSDTVLITNVMLVNSIRLASLPASSRITVNEPTDPADDDPATPAAMTLYTDYYSSVSDADADDYIRFTTPATADSVLFEIEWLGDADLDIGLLNGTGSACATLPGACYVTMGTGNNPEVARWRLAANTTYQLDVWVYDPGHSPTTLYRIRTTKIQ